MNLSGEIVFAILSFIAFSIPIVGSLWKIFSVRESLSRDIEKTNDRITLMEKDIANEGKAWGYRLKLFEKHAENLSDKLGLGIHQTKELVNHVRERSKKEEESLNSRLADVEGFLEKTTEFTKRRN